VLPLLVACADGPGATVVAFHKALAAGKLEEAHGHLSKSATAMVPPALLQALLADEARKATQNPKAHDVTIVREEVQGDLGTVYYFTASSGSAERPKEEAVIREDGAWKLTIKSRAGRTQAIVDRGPLDDMKTERGMLALAKSDLKNLASSQESYFARHNTYATTKSALSDFRESPGVRVTIDPKSDAHGWAATATHESLPARTCSIHVGPIFAAADGEEGRPRCS